MNFTVPQFIEREPKIWLNMTFGQFLYVGAGGVICVMLYFSLAKTRLLIFILLAAIIMLLAMTLAFLKVGGRSLPMLLKNFFFFTLAPKIYLWRRKNVPPKMIKRAEAKIEPADDGTSSLKLARKSQLKDLSTQIETKL